MNKAKQAQNNNNQNRLKKQIKKVGGVQNFKLFHLDIEKQKISSSAKLLLPHSVMQIHTDVCVPVHTRMVQHMCSCMYIEVSLSLYSLFMISLKVLCVSMSGSCI